MRTSSKIQEKKTSTADIAVEKYTKSRVRPRGNTANQQQSSDAQDDSKYTSIRSNIFHQIVVQAHADTSPEEQSAAVTKAIAFDESKSKQENEASLAAFEQFKDYLMFRRKQMSKAIIRLSDTEAFSELQAVFDQMNTSLLQFENEITPLVAIIDAVHRLNTASDGAMYDVFKEIEEDKAEEELLAQEKATLEDELNSSNKAILSLQQDIAVLKTKTRFLIGGLSKNTLSEIAKKMILIRNHQKDIASIHSKVESLVSTRKTKFANLAPEKAKLRELLDLTSDEHKSRQEALVNAAMSFVETTEKRTGSVLQHMEKLKSQIKNVDTVNGQMKRVFAVVTQGIKDAELQNTELTKTLNLIPEQETELQKYDREDQLESVNQHVELLNLSKLDTLSTYGELQEESMNIKSMRDTNQQQVAQTRKIHTSGTAGVASRLSTVLSAVSSAALNEARATTQNTLSSMNNITQGIAQNEAIQNATNLHIQNDALATAIDQLATYKDVSDKATAITRAALQDQKQLQREMEQTAAELSTAVQYSKSVTAEVMQGDARGNIPTENKVEIASAEFEL